MNNDPVSSNSQSTSSYSSEKTECTAHSFGEWETVKEASCIAGEKQRVCENCDFTETEEIPALNDFFAHTFDENTLCTTCGHQEFIESEEYITIQKEAVPAFGWHYDLYTWNSIDKTYGLQILKHNLGLFIYGYIGTPVNVVIPTSINGTPITTIGGEYGLGCVALPFKNCQTIESILIPEPIGSYNDAFRGSSLKKAYFKEGDNSAEFFSSHNPDVEILYY
jgi:hypothetical protein